MGEGGRERSIFASDSECQNPGTWVAIRRRDSIIDSTRFSPPVHVRAILLSDLYLFSHEEKRPELDHLYASRLLTYQA